jgi:hypothetical protein
MKFPVFILMLCSTAHAASILPNSRAEDMLSTSTCLKYSCKRIKSAGRKDFESTGTTDTFKFPNSIVEIYYAESRNSGNIYIDFIEISFNYSRSPNSINEVCSILKTVMPNSQYINRNFCKSLLIRPNKYGSVQTFRFRPSNSETLYAFNTISTAETMKISINRIPNNN